MKTHKDCLRRNWYRGSLLFAVSPVVAVIIAVWAMDVRWLAGCIPVMFLTDRFFPIKCSKCGKDIYVRPGTHAFDNLNFCQACGFDLKTPLADAAGAEQGKSVPDKPTQKDCPDSSRSDL